MVLIKNPINMYSFLISLRQTKKFENLIVMKIKN